MVPRPDPRLSGARAFAPITTRSSQGSAVTGRYAESPGAIKVLSPYADPYVSMDASPMSEPEPAPQRQTAPTQAVDDGYVDTPVSEKELAIDKKLNDEIRDTSYDLAKNFALSAGVPTAAGITAGFPAGTVLPATLGSAIMGAPQLAAVNLGFKAVNEGGPAVYAMARRALDESSLEDDTLGKYRTEQGYLNLDDMPDDEALDTIQRTAEIDRNYADRSQPLTTQIGNALSSVTAPVTGWLDENVMSPVGQRAREALNYMDENVVSPVKNFFGFDEAMDTAAPEQSQIQGLDESALDQAAENPDFAISDYEYSPNLDQAANMAMMREREEQKRQEEADRRAEDRAAAMASIGSQTQAGRPNSDMRGDGGLSGANTGVTSSPGAVGNRTASRGGFKAEDARAFGGGGYGRGAGSNGGRGGAGNNY